MTRLVRVRSDQMVIGLDVEALDARRNQECRGASVHWYIRIGDRYDDEKGSDRCIAGEVLPPSDHPVIAVADGTGGEDPGIGAALRLGDRKAGKDLAGQQPGQIAVFLVLSAEAGDNLCVTRVRRLGPEHDRGPRTAAQNLVDQRQLDRAETLAAEFGAEMRCP